MKNIFFIKILSIFLIFYSALLFINYHDLEILPNIIAQKNIHIDKDSILATNDSTLSIQDKKIIVYLLANQLETKINKSVAMLEMASKLPEIRTLPNASLIDPSVHGVPKNTEIEKRSIAQNILSSDPDFDRIFYILPNGDMYLEEPFFRQQNLSMDNFVSRDYFRGALSTGDTFLGNVILSASSGLPQFNIAIPLYSLNSNSSKINSTNNLIGLFAGDQDTSKYDKELQSVPLSGNEIIIYVDGNGKIISSSSPFLFSSKNTKPEFISSLQSFKYVITNKSGHIIEDINGEKMLIVYSPVKFKTTTWGVLLISNVENQTKSNNNIN